MKQLRAVSEMMRLDGGSDQIASTDTEILDLSYLRIPEQSFPIVFSSEKPLDSTPAIGGDGSNTVKPKG